MVEIKMFHVLTRRVDKIIHKSNLYRETDLNENYKPHFTSQNKMYVANRKDLP